MFPRLAPVAFLSTSRVSCLSSSLFINTAFASATNPLGEDGFFIRDRQIAKAKKGVGQRYRYQCCVPISYNTHAMKQANTMARAMTAMARYLQPMRICLCRCLLSRGQKRWKSKTANTNSQGMMRRSNTPPYGGMVRFCRHCLLFRNEVADGAGLVELFVFHGVRVALPVGDVAAGLEVHVAE